MQLDVLYQDYRKLSLSLPLRFRWLSYILAPWRITLIVVVAGIVAISGAVMVTLGVAYVGSSTLSASVVASLLIAGFVAEGCGSLIKQRFELILTFIVRHLTYRRFRDLFEARSTHEGRAHVLTYPGQISQFAYLVDAAITCVKIGAFLAVALVLYGWSGVVASVIIAGLVAVSVRLIHLIGVLWERYIEMEGERRRWIQLLGEAMPRGPWSPRWDYAVGKAAQIRENQEDLLRKRVRLQMVNGFLDSGALTITLCISAILGVWLWPEGNLGIGIILAARYLYSAVQNNLVNYRVIRLATPMMRDLDALELGVRDSIKHTTTEPSQAPTTVEVIGRTSERGQELLTSAGGVQSAFVPRNPDMHQIVLSAWGLVRTSLRGRGRM